MTNRVTLMLDGHEYSIDYRNGLSDSVQLRVDGRLCDPVRNGYLWGDARILDYFLKFQERRARISLMLWREHFYSPRKNLIIKRNGDVVHGAENYRKYKIGYYRYLSRRSLLLKQGPALRLVMMEWKRALGYYFSVLVILFALGMFSIAGAGVFAALTVLIFLGIGVKDNIDLKTQARDDG